MSVAPLSRTRRAVTAHPPIFETLEPRLLLDGNVTAFAVGGGLFIYGDPLDNDILIEQGVTPDEFTITGQTGTTVNTVGPTVAVPFAGVTGGMSFWLGDGDDAIQIVDCTIPGTVWIDHGTGGSTTTVAPTAIGGPVYVWCGSGLDTFSLTGGGVGGFVHLYNGAGGSVTTLTDTSVTGDVFVINGDGNDQFVLDNTGTPGGIGGSLFINNGPGGSSTTLTNTLVANSIYDINGDGLDDFMATLALIGGSLHVANGNGGSDTQLTDVTVNGDVVVTNGDDYDEFLWNNSGVVGVGLQGMLSIANGDGGSDTTLLNTEVGGSVHINTGAGAAQFTMDHSVIDGWLTILRGNGGDLPGHPGWASWVSITDDDTPALDLGGTVTIINGAGNDQTRLIGMDFGGSVTVNNGADAGETIVNACDLAGSLTVNRGDGGDMPTLPGFASYLEIEHTNIGGSLNVMNGTGNDKARPAEVSFGGSVNVHNGAGGADFQLNTVDVAGWLTVTRGSGGNLPNHAGWASWTHFAHVGVAGTVTILNGAGDDRIDLPEAWPTNIDGNLWIDNGPDGANVTVGGCTVAGWFTLLRGNGGDLAPTHTGFASWIDIDPATIGGNLTIINGTGDELVRLFEVTVGGSLYINHGPDAAEALVWSCNVAGSATILRGDGGVLQSGGWSGYTDVDPTPIGGDLTILSGTGEDYVAVTGDFAGTRTTVGGNVTVNTGAGDDLVEFDGGVTVIGSALVDTGAGDDYLEFNDTHVGGTTLLRSGPGWTAASDDDTVEIDMWDTIATPSTFTGLFSLYTGFGDDTVGVGAAPANDTAVFTTLAILDGGPGSDTLDYLTYGNIGTIIPLNWTTIT